MTGLWHDAARGQRVLFYLLKLISPVVVTVVNTQIPMATTTPLPLEHLQAWLQQSLDPDQRANLVAQAIHHQAAALLMQGLAQHTQPCTLMLMRLLRNLCAGNASVAEYMLQEGIVDGIARAAACGRLGGGDARVCKAAAQLLCNASTTDVSVACGVWKAAWPDALLAFLRAQDGTESTLGHHLILHPLPPPCTAAEPVALLMLRAVMASPCTAAKDVVDDATPWASTMWSLLLHHPTMQHTSQVVETCIKGLRLF